MRMVLLRLLEPGVVAAIDKAGGAVWFAQACAWFRVCWGLAAMRSEGVGQLERKIGRVVE